MSSKTHAVIEVEYDKEFSLIETATSKILGRLEVSHPMSMDTKSPGLRVESLTVSEDGAEVAPAVARQLLKHVQSLHPNTPIRGRDGAYLDQGIRFSVAQKAGGATEEPLSFREGVQPGAMAGAAVSITRIPSPAAPELGNLKRAFECLLEWRSQGPQPYRLGQPLFERAISFSRKDDKDCVRIDTRHRLTAEGVQPAKWSLPRAWGKEFSTAEAALTAHDWEVENGVGALMPDGWKTTNPLTVQWLALDSQIQALYRAACNEAVLYLRDPSINAGGDQRDMAITLSSRIGRAMELPLISIDRPDDGECMRLIMEQHAQNADSARTGRVSCIAPQRVLGLANLAGIQLTESLFHEARMKIIQESIDDQMQRVEEGVRRLGSDNLSAMSADDLVAAIRKEIASAGWMDLSDEADAKMFARPMTELLAFGVMPPPDANERWDGGGRLGIFTKADISLLAGKIQGNLDDENQEEVETIAIDRPN